MNRKGQAAMEFLMTYGWAIIIVLAAIGALAYFGVLSPQKLLPDRTVFPAPLPNVDNAVITLGSGVNPSTVQIAFINNKGVPISITQPGTGVFTSAQCTSGALEVNGVIDSANNSIIYGTGVPISNGEGFLVTWTCTQLSSSKVGDKFKADITFDYKNEETGQTIKQTGSVEGKYS